jgi:para-aminobenzoate synthetase component 1
VAIDLPDALHVSLDLAPDELAARVGRLDTPALLESGPGFGAAGRWSFLAARPVCAVVAPGALGHEVHGPAAALPPLPWEYRPVIRLDTLAPILDSLGMGAGGVAPGPDDPPFRGGWIGYHGYDLAPQIERLPRRAPPDTRTPDLWFALYDTVVTRDHHRGTVTLSAYDILKQGRPALQRRLDAWLAALHAPMAPIPVSRLRVPPMAGMSRDRYLRAVERAIGYIGAGDVFQVNLSQRFTTGGDLDPLDLYLRLRAISPAPFAAYIRHGRHAVASASPEWLYQTRGDQIVTRPIKGTRPRGRDPEEDARQAASLLSSPKDRAELTMIVDLERNDLGRVCEYGSVRVPEALALETYAQVHHLVATVEGRLRPDRGPIDVVRALFPGGSITGAPKIRAMQIIDELEPSRRGLYTGAIGYYSFGASAFNIAIRTLLVEGSRVSYQVGGGIVADSDPEAEYEETLHKGAGLKAVLEGAGP